MSQQINLYNPLFRKKSFSLMSAAAMLCMAGIAVACAVLVAVYQNYRLTEAQTRARTIENAYTDASARHDRLIAEVAKQKPNPQLEGEVASLETLLRARQEVMATLQSGAVGSADGFSEYLRAFSRQSVSGLWLTGFDIGLAGNALALQGRTLNAEHVASYLKGLNQEKTMQGRQFAAMRISQPPPQAANPAEKSEGKARPPSPPRYLEFTISTQEIPDAARQAANAASVAPPLLGALNSSARIDSAEAAGGQAVAR